MCIMMVYMHIGKCMQAESAAAGFSAFIYSVQLHHEAAHLSSPAHTEILGQHASKLTTV
jgi:hypothetical protein